MSETKTKLWFWVLLNVLLVVIILATVAVILPAIANYSNSFTPAREITVDAQGMTTATPDLAELTFSVVTTGANPQSLSTSNTDKMNAVLQFVSSQNIASSDIKTTNYDLSPNYQYDNATQRNFVTGYTLTQTVQVKIHDLSNVATIVGGLTPLGVNQIGGITFTFNDPDTFIALARTDALNKAQQKAQAIASQIGALLGPVMNVSEENNVPGPLPVFAMSSAANGGVSASTPNIQPGSSDITDNVTVTYALR
jgi:uncharacterized protein YggE